MIDATYLRGIGPLKCTQCATDEQKEHVYRSGFVSLWCDRCQDNTTHCAFDGDALRRLGDTVYENATIKILVRDGRCFVTNKVLRDTGEILPDFQCGCVIQIVAQ